jgi:hypothetical protein
MQFIFDLEKIQQCARQLFYGGGGCSWKASLIDKIKKWMMRKCTYLSYTFHKSWIRIYDIAQPCVLATEYLKMGSKRFSMVWSCDQVRTSRNHPSSHLTPSSNSQIVGSRTLFDFGTWYQKNGLVRDNMSKVASFDKSLLKREVLRFSAPHCMGFGNRQDNCYV